VFENGTLRRKLEPKNEEVIKGWRKLHNKDLHNLYFSPDMIRVIKPRTTRWERNVARTGQKKIL
jgi:hypothetical protein